MGRLVGLNNRSLPPHHRQLKIKKSTGPNLHNWFNIQKRLNWREPTPRRHLPDIYSGRNQVTDLKLIIFQL